MRGCARRKRWILSASGCSGLHSLAIIGDFFDPFMAEKQAGIDLFGLKIGAQSHVEIVGRAMIAASEEIDEAGAIFGIGVEACVALRKKIDDCDGRGMEDVGFLAQHGCSRGLHRIVHRLEHAGEIGDRLEVAVEIACDKVFAGKAVLLSEECLEEGEDK